MRLHAAPARVAVHLAAATLAMAAASLATAQVAAVSREATAVRGAPVLIEVRVGADATLPPLEIVSPSGARAPAEARVIWPFVPPIGRGALVRWACASNPLRMADERPAGADSAYLAVELPAGLEDRAQIAFGASAVTLSLVDAAPADLLAQLATRASMVAPQGERDAMLSLPDPDAPFERFRFELGAALRAWPEPSPFPEASGNAIAARAHSALWRAALARILESGAGPAVELAELLVASCGDATAPAQIAAWIAHPEELRTVQRLALDREFSGARLASGINEFLRVRSPVLWWVEDSDRESVTVAFANPSTRAQVVRYQWVAGSDIDVLPLVLDVPAAEVRRARITRPAPSEQRLVKSDAPAAVEQLRVQCGNFAANVTAPPASLSVTPRGIEVAECFAPLNLLSVSVGARTKSLAVRGTTLAVRERLAGWEIFIELLDIDGTGGGSSDSLSAYGGTGGSVRIDASGAVSTQACDLAVDTVEFRASAGRARASFFVPPEWIRREETGTGVDLGFRRTFAAGFADAPFACVPWRKSPRTAAIDLSAR